MAGGSCIARLARKPDCEDVDTNVLRRCLTRWDLAALGVGSSLGAGVYALVGYVALNVAGPAVVASFAVAGVAALLSGLCYAEFSGRVPRAGSAYHYAFVSLGEAAAFAIGWSIVLESLFGAASMARGLSLYADALTNGSMSGWFRAVAPLDAPPLGPHFDILAFLIVMAFGVIISIGVRESMVLNNVLVCINLAVVVFIIIAGAVMADVSNWRLPAEAAGAGGGGFLPFGAWGVLRGAAVCFCGFVGFDVVTFAAEETREPRRSLPLVLLLVPLMLCAVYCSVAAVITMMMPYYLQDNITAVVAAFSYVGWDFAKWPISFGAIVGISSGMFGAIYALSRLLYAMASDRLLLPCLAGVSGGRSPVAATLVATGIISVLSSLLELEQLVLTMCLGSLLCYCVVAVGVIVIRYQSDFVSQVPVHYGRQIFGLGHKMATRHTSRLVNVLVSLFTSTCVASALVLVLAPRPLVPAAALHGLALLLIIVIALQPSLNEKLVFKTPLVPLVPCLSIYVNVHLMVLINWQTWVRVFIWMIIGVPVYFLSFCCWKSNSDLSKGYYKESVNFTNGNAKVAVTEMTEISPPASVRSKNDVIEVTKEEENDIEIFTEVVKKDIAVIAEEIVVKQATIDVNEEKEAIIIEMLDKVIQAEEERSYKDTPPLDENKEELPTSSTETIPHRMSLSELSDAGSDTVAVLSKYDVIAQVHREDLPKVYEETYEETDAESKLEEEKEDHEKVTFFNESETNSRTDESGYFDTTEETQVHDSIQRNSFIIPSPPPLDENYFTSPTFIKSYTIPARPKAQLRSDQTAKPRDSIQSNGSYDDNNIVFGSARQMKFMSKLNDILQTKRNEPEEVEVTKSSSTENVPETHEAVINYERPAFFYDLKKELLAKDLQTLRPTKKEDRGVEIKEDEENDESSSGEDELSRTDLKSKLENLFAAGHPNKVKSRPRAHPPALDESLQAETSSTESLAKLPKIEKNDTLKRQKDKFGEVLNSLKSLNKSDLV